MRSHRFAAGAGIAVGIAVVIIALVIAVYAFSIWVALLLAAVLVVLGALAFSPRIADTRYTRLAGMSGGFCAFATLLAVGFLAQRDLSAFTLALPAVVLVATGVFSGRRQRQSLGSAQGVVTATVASALVALAVAVAIWATTIFVLLSVFGAN